jgi:hypothetical protein
VYKYRAAAHLHRLEEIVLQNLLYFPTARDLNDPAEARPPLTASSIDALIDKIADDAIQSRPHLTNRGLAYHAQVIDYNVRRFGKKRVLSLMREDLEPLLTRFRIYSLSKRPDNPHLRAEYAAQHTGYCLEFRSAGLGQIFEVRYEDDIAVDITDSKQLEPYFLFYKTKKWRREDEVRMIKQQESEAHSTFDPAALTRIILGRNIAPPTKAQYARLREDGLCLCQSRPSRPSHRVPAGRAAIVGRADQPLMDEAQKRGESTATFAVHVRHLGGTASDHRLRHRAGNEAQMVAARRQQLGLDREAAQRVNSLPA